MPHKWKCFTDPRGTIKKQKRDEQMGYRWSIWCHTETEHKKQDQNMRASFQNCSRVFSPFPFLSVSLFPLVLYILPQLTSPWFLFLFNCNSSLNPYQLYKRRNQDAEAHQCNRSAIVNLNLCIWDLDHINVMLRSTRSEAVIFTVCPQHRAKMSLQCSMSWLWKIFPKVWTRWVMGMNVGNEKLLTNMDQVKGHWVVMNLISNKVTKVFQCGENDNLCFGYGGKTGRVEKMPWKEEISRLSNSLKYLSNCSSLCFLLSSMAKTAF